MADTIVFSNGSNHSFETAQELHINEIVYGNMTSVNIDDYYKINFNGNGQMQFLLKINDNTKYNMYIYEEDNLTTHIAHMGGNLGSDRSITRLVENKTYYIRIYAYDADSIYHNSSGYDYNLQFIPTAVTSMSLSIVGLENSEIAKNSTAALMCTYGPANAYTDFTYESTYGKVTITGDTLRAVANGNDIVTVSSYGSTVSDSVSLTIYTSISMNQNRCNNWNQFYTDIVNTLNSTSGCSWTAGLDVANIYGPSSYEPDDMPASAWDSGAGYYWHLPSGCAGAVQDYGSSGLGDSELLSQICEELDNNRPVIIELYRSGLANPQHFVVAYKYYNNGTSKSDIRVFDPGVGPGSSSQKNGLDHTLPAAEEHNSNKMMRRLRKTTGR